MKIGEKIRSLREKRGWSQRELSKRVGINNSVLSRIESGKRPVEDHEILKFADVFEVSTDELLGRNPYTEKEMKFLDDVENGIPIQHLLQKYDLTMDGAPLTEEEIRGVIAYIRASRTSKSIIEE